MSGLWILIVLCFWGSFTWSLWKVCKKFMGSGMAFRPVRIGIITAGAMLWLGVSFWHAGGMTIYYDQMIDRMCRVDGGIKVYETVKLPVEKFNLWNQPNFYKPSEKENSLGPDYIFTKEKHRYRTVNPEISRQHLKIFRRSDNKLLGESVYYGRGGGNLIGPWHDSSYTCPNDYGDIPLLTHIFIPLLGGNK